MTVDHTPERLSPEFRALWQAYCDEKEARADVEARLAAVEVVAATAKPGMSLPPIDCTNECYQGPCNCSGESRTISWRIDLPALQAALHPDPERGPR